MQVSEVSNHFLESCDIKEKEFYSSLGHSSIPVQFSETTLNCHLYRGSAVNLMKTSALWERCSLVPRLSPRMTTANSS